MLSLSLSLCLCLSLSVSLSLSLSFFHSLFLNCRFKLQSCGGRKKEEIFWSNKIIYCHVSFKFFVHFVLRRMRFAVEGRTLESCRTRHSNGVNIACNMQWNMISVVFTQTWILQKKSFLQGLRSLYFFLPEM